MKSKNRAPTSTPLVSVLMCAHNSATFIESAIQSILNQSYENFELVIVENGSTDDTFDIASSFQDARIRIFRTSLKQLTFNLNFGLNHCRGKYIARMDSDDTAHPDRLRQQVEFLETNSKIDFVGSYMATFGKHSTTLRYPISHRGIVALSPFKTVMAHPTVIGKANAFLDCGGYHGLKFAEDLDFWLSSMRRGKRFANIPLELVNYRIHDDQARGKKEAYASAAGTLLKHSLLTKNPIYLVGSFVGSLKFLIFGR